VTELLHLSALELGERIRRRALSSEEATRFYLDRIERLDPALSSFVTVLKRRALSHARIDGREEARRAHDVSRGYRRR